MASKKTKKVAKRAIEAWAVGTGKKVAKRATKPVAKAAGPKELFVTFECGIETGTHYTLAEAHEYYEGLDVPYSVVRYLRDV